jgi:hypothetical protein
MREKKDVLKFTDCMLNQVKATSRPLGKFRARKSALKKRKVQFDAIRCYAMNFCFHCGKKKEFAFDFVVFRVLSTQKLFLATCEFYF